MSWKDGAGQLGRAIALQCMYRASLSLFRSRFEAFMSGEFRRYPAVQVAMLAQNTCWPGLWT
jgi:hypothetical protein